MGNDGGAVGKSGGGATMEKHRALVTPSGAAGVRVQEAFAREGERIYGMHEYNIGPRGSVSRAEEAAWVASGGREGIRPTGGARGKGADQMQNLLTQNLGVKANGMAGRGRFQVGNRFSRTNTREPSPTLQNSYVRAVARSPREVRAARAEMRRALGTQGQRNAINVKLGKFRQVKRRDGSIELRQYYTKRTPEYKGVSTARPGAKGRAAVREGRQQARAARQRAGVSRQQRAAARQPRERQRRRR
jgi:hypothetical protein